ncbi:expressed unknown protein [Seminavis robusta]|uniref:Uncharacterized protein n=1 Tax=Seminavis robusta TaxID=568900 RepID=A0A9N8DB34_9STRA|nr:expressed unknown protein [Seminavis robusta]|eukprot:Sro68_g037900.1 n/a (277) ;mRNA; r:13222-14052
MATLSLKKACAIYGVTEEEIYYAGITIQWRRAFGNSHGVVVEKEIQKLKVQLRKEEQQAQKDKLLEELGEEGYQDYLKQQQEQKTRDKQRKQIQSILQIILTINAPDSSLHHLQDGVNVSKSVAKKIWRATDNDLEQLQGTKQGRTVVYSLQQVIETGLANGKDYRHKIILERLQKNQYSGNNEDAKNQYAAYYRHQLNAFPAQLVQEVAQQLLAPTQLQAKQLEVDLAGKRGSVQALEVLSSSGTEKDDTGTETEQGAFKKRKTTEKAPEKNKAE